MAPHGITFRFLHTCYSVLKSEKSAILGSHALFVNVFDFFIQMEQSGPKEAPFLRAKLIKEKIAKNVTIALCLSLLEHCAIERVL